jgi:Ca2+-binding RTX toxin-like protein
VVLAGTVNGTPKNDTLRGSAKADTINGKAGNDKLFGLAGKDVLIGGAGNDLLVGGAAADTLNCGAGNDRAQADSLDKVSPSCEIVKGLPPPPEVSIADATIAEGQSGTATLVFSVSLSGASSKSASVRFATADGTAVVASDYAAASGIVTFKPGEKAKSIAVSIVSDRIAEADETMTVTLSSPVGATVVDASGTGTITNDDVRSGRYTGTTSQGRSLTFDVSPDVASLANLRVFNDLDCVGVGTLPNLDLDFAGVSFPIASDWGVNINEASSDADGSITFVFTGKLVMPGNASGSLRIDMSLNTSFGVVNCSTGNVTWTAAAAG